MEAGSIVFGFSGNRPNEALGRRLADIEQMKPLMKLLVVFTLEQVNAVDVLPRLVVSAGAGANLVACEMAIEMQMPIELLLPKPVAAFRADFEGYAQSSWARVERVIEHCETGVHESSCRVCSVSAAGQNVYEAVNAEILAASDVMLFLWNGLDTGKAGGTGDFIQKTADVGRPRFVLDTTKHLVGNLPELLDGPVKLRCALD